jgi:Ran-interacting Mog1 protein
MTAEISFVSNQLFGGSATCSLPLSWKDLSTYHEVPDNQECFFDDDNQCLLVIEILERQAISDDEAPLFFFNDLAEANDSSARKYHGTASEKTSSRSLSDAALFFGSGSYRSRKPRRQSSALDNEDYVVSVELCVLRLLKQQTDLLISLTSPSDSLDQRHSIGNALINRVANSFDVIDWTLFG